MIRKVTNKGITMLCQHIYNSCTIAISANEQCWYVALLHELIVCMKTLIDQMGLLCAIVWIFRSVCKSKIASVVMTTIRSFDTLHWGKLNTLSNYLLNIMGYFKINLISLDIKKSVMIRKKMKFWRRKRNEERNDYKGGSMIVIISVITVTAFSGHFSHVSDSANYCWV